MTIFRRRRGIQFQLAPLRYNMSLTKPKQRPTHSVCKSTYIYVDLLWLFGNGLPLYDYEIGWKIERWYIDIVVSDFASHTAQCEIAKGSSMNQWSTNVCERKIEKIGRLNTHQIIIIYGEICDVFILCVCVCVVRTQNGMSVESRIVIPFLFIWLDCN